MNTVYLPIPESMSVAWIPSGEEKYIRIPGSSFPRRYIRIAIRPQEKINRFGQPEPAGIPWNPGVNEKECRKQQTGVKEPRLARMLYGHCRHNDSSERKPYPVLFCSHCIVPVRRLSYKILVRIRISIVVPPTVRMILNHSSQRLLVTNPCTRHWIRSRAKRIRIPADEETMIPKTGISAVNDHCTLSFLRKFHMTKRIEGKRTGTESPSSKYSYKILKFNGIISCGESLRAQYYACGWFSQTVTHRLTMVKPFGFWRIFSRLIIRGSTDFSTRQRRLFPKVFGIDFYAAEQLFQGNSVIIAKNSERA